MDITTCSSLVFSLCTIWFSPKHFWVKLNRRFRAYVTSGRCAFALRRRVYWAVRPCHDASRSRRAKWEGRRDGAGQHEGSGRAPPGSAAKVPYITCGHTDCLRVFCVLCMCVMVDFGASVARYLPWNCQLSVECRSAVADVCCRCRPVVELLNAKVSGCVPETTVSRVVQSYWTCWPEIRPPEPNTAPTALKWLNKTTNMS